MSIYKYIEKVHELLNIAVCNVFETFIVSIFKKKRYNVKSNTVNTKKKQKKTIE